MKRRAFSITELLLATAIAVILSAIFLPVVARAKSTGQWPSDMRHLHEIEWAQQMYYRDNDELRDGRQTVDNNICAGWKQVVYPYVRRTETYVDPENVSSQYLDGFSLPGVRSLICPASSEPLGNLPILDRSYYWNNLFHSTQIFGDNFDNAGMPLSEVRSPEKAGDVVEGRSLFDDIGPFSQGWVDNVDGDTSWLGGANPVTGMIGSSLSGIYHEKGQNVAFLDGHVRPISYREICRQFANVGADAANCAAGACQSPAPVWQGNPKEEGFWNFSENDINAAIATTWAQFPNAVAQYCTSLPPQNQR